MSARGEILGALFAALSGVGGNLLRNEAMPASVPDGGLVIMREGEPGEPKSFIGRARPLEHYEHAVKIEIYSDAVAPEQEIYGIAEEIAAIARANRSLGGKVEAVTVGAIEVEAIPVDDGAPIVVGTLPVTLHYTLEVAA